MPIKKNNILSDNIEIRKVSHSKHESQFVEYTLNDIQSKEKVGHIYLYLEDDGKTWYLADIEVFEKFQKKGYGSLAIRYIIKDLRIKYLSAEVISQSSYKAFKKALDDNKPIKMEIYDSLTKQNIRMKEFDENYIMKHLPTNTKYRNDDNHTYNIEGRIYLLWKI